MKKQICALLGTLFLIFCGSQDVQNEKKAETPMTSGIVLTHFDKNVRATDDFYRYVNGKWLNEAEIPAEKSSYGVINELFDENEKQLKAIVEEVSKKEELADGSDEQKMRDLYLSFMNVEKREALGMTPIQDDLDLINSIKNADQLITAMHALGMKGTNTPIGFFVNQDSKNATKYIGYFTQAGLGLPDRDYYLQEGERFDIIRSKYVELIEKQWINAGLEKGGKAAEQVMQLETAIAKLHWTRIQNRDREKTYNKFTISELKELSKGFNWDLLIKEMGLTKEESFILRQPDFVQEVTALFKSNPLSSWQTYLTWKVLDQNASALTASMDEANFEFYSKTLRGTQAQRPLWKRGIQTVNAVLGDSLGKVYVERHFPPEAKLRMDDLVKNLIQAYDEALAELEWMGEETRTAARTKLSKVTPKIGYPNKWKDYTAITIKPHTLQANLESAQLWGYNEMMSKLGKPIDREEWHMSPQTINAYYNPSMNEIVFPAGILQPPMFNLEADDAVNYGAICMIIGHELGHAFDDQGSRSDGDGNLNNWWSDQDRSEFEKRTKILVDQYNEFSPIEGIHVNGELTLGENIGDLGGTTIAFRAYNISLKGKESPILDGYTGAQRFFIGGAQLSRNKKRDAALQQQVMTDPHSPKEYRVNGVVANMPEFYEAFGVVEGDKLFRPKEKRVKIW